jgi:hypothetical protein
MKILFLAHRTPFPPNKGEKIRAYHILAQLAKSHSVSMAYWVDRPDDIDHARVLRKFCQGAVVPTYLNSSSAMLRGMKSLFHGRSFSEGYPQTKVEIVGGFPPRSVRKLDGLGGVRVFGEVADVRSYLVQADVSVAPMRIARGVQNKVLGTVAIQ